MYLLYLDDSGSIRNKDEKYFVLAGILIREDKLYWINKHLDDLAQKISPGNPNSIEFHASEIYSSNKEPWKQYSRDKRIDTIKSVLNVIHRESKNVALFACAVHRPSFPTFDPVELAFENLCSRFDLFLNRIYRQNNESHRGLIIFDESSHETSIQRLAIEFRQMGTRWGVTKNLLEVPLFVNSQASRAIQLADHVSYAVRRRYECADLNYFNIIEGNFDADSDRIHGLVHKQTLLQDCTCPACIIKRFRPIIEGS